MDEETKDKIVADAIRWYGEWLLGQTLHTPDPFVNYAELCPPDVEPPAFSYEKWTGRRS